MFGGLFNKEERKRIRAADLFADLAGFPSVTPSGDAEAELPRIACGEAGEQGDVARPLLALH